MGQDLFALMYSSIVLPHKINNLAIYLSVPKVYPSAKYRQQWAGVLGSVGNRNFILYSVVLSEYFSPELSFQTLLSRLLPLLFENSDFVCDFSRCIHS